MPSGVKLVLDRCTDARFSVTSASVYPARHRLVGLEDNGGYGFRYCPIAEQINSRLVVRENRLIRMCPVFVQEMARTRTRFCAHLRKRRDSRKSRRWQR